MFAGDSRPRHLLCARGTLRDRRRTSGALTNSNSLLRGSGGCIPGYSGLSLLPSSGLQARKGATDVLVLGSV